MEPKFRFKIKIKRGMHRVAWLKRQEEGEDEIVATPLINMRLGAIGFCLRCNAWASFLSTKNYDFLWMHTRM
jgi:hypothetical protein